MKLYAACPLWAPDIETSFFLAKDDAAALENASILLGQDNRTGYDSPFIRLWEIKADVREVGGVGQAVEA